MTRIVRRPLVVALILGLMAPLLALSAAPAGAAVGDTPEIVVQPNGNHWYLANGSRNWVPQWCADQHRNAGATIRTAEYSEFSHLPSVNNGCPAVGTISGPTTTTTTAPASEPTTSSGTGNGEIVVQTDNNNHWYLVDGTKNWIPQWCADQHRNAGATIRGTTYSEFGSRPVGGHSCPDVGTLATGTTSGSTSETTTTTAPSPEPTTSSSSGNGEIVVQTDNNNHWYLVDGTKNWIPQWCADQHRNAGATIRGTTYSEFGSRPVGGHSCPDVGTLTTGTTSGSGELPEGSGALILNPTPTPTASTEATDFFKDPETYVTRVYQTMFDRAPDSGGLAYWAGKIYSRPVVKYPIISGPTSDCVTEAARIPLHFWFTTEGFQVYDRLMDLPDSPTAWHVEQGLIRFVNRYYELFLGRTADAEGLNYWVDRLMNISGRADRINFINAQFAGSNEGQAKLLRLCENRDTRKVPMGAVTVIDGQQEKVTIRVEGPNGLRLTMRIGGYVKDFTLGNHIQDLVMTGIPSGAYNLSLTRTDTGEVIVNQPNTHVRVGGCTHAQQTDLEISAVLKSDVTPAYPFNPSWIETVDFGTTRIAATTCRDANNNWIVAGFDETLSARRFGGTSPTLDPQPGTYSTQVLIQSIEPLDGVRFNGNQGVKVVLNAVECARGTNRIGLDGAEVLLGMTPAKSVALLGPLDYIVSNVKYDLVGGVWSPTVVSDAIKDKLESWTDYRCLGTANITLLLEATANGVIVRDDAQVSLGRGQRLSDGLWADLTMHFS